MGLTAHMKSSFRLQSVLRLSSGINRLESRLPLQSAAMVANLLYNRLRTLIRASPQLQNQLIGSPSWYANFIRHHSDPVIQAAASDFGTRSSLNQEELKKFSAISETWWDAEGPFKPLHAMNPTRLAFIRSTLCRHFGKNPNCSRPFKGLEFVDVGCGGGILSEPLARMGASVTGVDAVEKNIKIARIHADLDKVTSSIDYQCTTAEKLVHEGREFDAVIALEVIEHVADPADFCKSLSALTRIGGANLISTINRSMRAYATAIVLAEYLLNWLPVGTHQWSSFLTPQELVLILERASLSVQEMAGFVYNPLTGKWALSDDISVNFIAFANKTTNERN